MGLFTEISIRTAFKYGRRVRKGELTPTRSSLCRSRQRLGIAPVRLLFQQTVRPLAERTTPGCFFHGFRKMAFDSDLPPVTVPVVKLLFAAPLGQPLHFVEA